MQYLPVRKVSLCLYVTRIFSDFNNTKVSVANVIVIWNKIAFLFIDF